MIMVKSKTYPSAVLTKSNMLNFLDQYDHSEITTASPKFWKAQTHLRFNAKMKVCYTEVDKINEISIYVECYTTEYSFLNYFCCNTKDLGKDK